MVVLVRRSSSSSSGGGGIIVVVIVVPSVPFLFVLIRRRAVRNSAAAVAAAVAAAAAAVLIRSGSFFSRRVRRGHPFFLILTGRPNDVARRIEQHWWEHHSARRGHSGVPLLTVRGLRRAPIAAAARARHIVDFVVAVLALRATVTVAGRRRRRRMAAELAKTHQIVRVWSYSLKQHSASQKFLPCTC